MDRKVLLFDCALYALCLVHIFSCPFTKVEESFNVQASHDLLFHGAQLSEVAFKFLSLCSQLTRVFVAPVRPCSISGRGASDIPWCHRREQRGGPDFAGVSRARAAEAGVPVCRSVRAPA